ncbi:integrin alpha [Marivirga tractuosa]|uniref:integrin alpha n=1 Tax=Marivirga tractuosa TaxID=1006 RepID=UPI0035D07194
MNKLLLLIQFFTLIFLLIFRSNLSAQNYPPVLDKSTLKGGKGIIFPNIDLEGSNSYGNDVNFIGDINNDGLEDIAISSDYAVIDGNDFTGKVYVVFGTEDEFDDTFDLNNLNGDNGFVVEGIAEDERRGGINAGVGDINGDGIDDVIIGSDQSSQNVIVLYGRSSFPALIESSDIDGNNGFVITFSGSNSVAGLGDVNGDGINDFIIGTPHWSGRARIVFGRTNNFPIEIDESYLDGTKGFSTTSFPASRASYIVGGAGDINNDGINDILIGSWNTHSSGPDEEKISYALFGKNEPFDPLIEITDVDGSDGFSIDNRDNSFITHLRGIGDINGDGIDDCFSENNVIFGSNDPFPSALLRS